MKSRILRENDANNIINAAYTASKEYVDEQLASAYERPRSGDCVWSINEQITYIVAPDGEIISQYNSDNLKPILGLGQIVHVWAKKKYGDGRLGMGVYALMSNQDPGGHAMIYPFIVTPYQTSIPLTLKRSQNPGNYAMRIRLIEADIDTYIESLTISTECAKTWGAYLVNSKGPESKFTVDLSYGIYKM